MADYDIHDMALVVKHFGRCTDGHALAFCPRCESYADERHDGADPNPDCPHDWHEVEVEEVDALYHRRGWVTSYYCHRCSPANPDEPPSRDFIRVATHRDLEG